MRSNFMLKSDRLTYRALEKEDVQFLYDNHNDGELSKYILTVKPLSMKTQEELIEHSNNDMVSGISNTFLIEDHHGSKIGLINLFKVNLINKNSTLFLWITKEQQNKGYGTESIKRILKFAFETLNLERVEIRALGKNLRANYLYCKKLGFVLEGTLRRSNYYDGLWDSKNIYSMLKSEYDELKKGYTPPTNNYSNDNYSNTNSNDLSNSYSNNSESSNQSSTKNNDYPDADYANIDTNSLFG